MLVDPIPELAPAQPEPRRGARDVPSRVPKGLRDPVRRDLVRDVGLRLRPVVGSRGRWPSLRGRGRRKLEGGRRYLGGLGEERGAGDDVLQLADVAGPLVREEGGAGVCGQRLRRPRRAGRRLAEKPLGERHDVIRALAEGRQAHRDHREAMVEVRAEATLASARLQVLAGRRDDPHVDRHAARRSQAPHRAFLEDREELGLGLRREQPHLVEEQRPAARLLHEPRLGVLRVRERAALEAEQLGFEEVRRDRRAVDGDEGALGPRAGAVKHAGHHALADPGLAQEEDRRGPASPRLCDQEAPERLADAGHRRALPDQLPQAVDVHDGIPRFKVPGPWEVHRRPIRLAPGRRRWPATG